MGEAAYYAEIFERKMREKSIHKGDFIQEWELAMKCHRAASQCICTHQIEENYFIRNKITGEQCIIGSDCVQRWLNPKMNCKKCKEPLGCIMTRIKKKDFYCRSCKLEIIKRNEEKERENRKIKQKTIKMFSSWTLAYPGPWKGKLFPVVCETEEWVETLINIPKWQGVAPPSYIYKSLHAFQKFADAKFEISEA